VVASRAAVCRVACLPYHSRASPLLDAALMTCAHRCCAHVLIGLLLCCAVLCPAWHFLHRGVEARVPFLDRHFLDVAMAIDPAEKMIDKSQGKACVAVTGLPLYCSNGCTFHTSSMWSVQLHCSYTAVTLQGSTTYYGGCTATGGVNNILPCCLTPAQHLPTLKLC
jgi:hypothetical protein